MLLLQLEVRQEPLLAAFSVPVLEPFLVAHLELSQELLPEQLQVILLVG